MIQQKYISSDNQSSYLNIFKATFLFGGVQVYQILISIIKSKVIAILLGPFLYIYNPAELGNEAWTNSILLEFMRVLFVG